MTAYTRGREDWFSGRKNHFVRQLLDDTMMLICRFQQLYDRYRCGHLPHSLVDQPAPGRTTGALPALHAEILQHLTSMVGTETRKGSLWRLKDLGHQIWPRHSCAPNDPGILLDWLIGALFHETVALKENLYLLHNYSAISAGQGRPNHLLANGWLADDIPDNIARQMERVGSLFGQVNYFIRLMLPDLIGNPLVVRLLVEHEEAVTELWGESVDSIFSDIFSGRADAGFCLAGASYARGQWFRQALRMYERALACNRQCDEARVRVAHLRALLQEEGDAE